jgi:hypothetical protein
MRKNVSLNTLGTPVTSLGKQQAVRHVIDDKANGEEARIVKQDGRPT